MGVSRSVDGIISLSRAIQLQGLYSGFRYKISLGSRLGSVTQPWVPHVGDIFVISGRIRIVMQVFCLWRSGAVCKAIMGMLSWFARLVLTKICHSKVIISDRGATTMSGIIVVL